MARVTSSKPSVLFVCVANSCRSQMAEAIAKSAVGDRWEVWSAGSSPSGRVHPIAMQAMEELGLDLSTHRSKGLGDVPKRQWDYVVSMGCRDACPPTKHFGGGACPSVPARRHIEWEIPDPVGLPMEEVRRIREQIAGLVRELVEQEKSI